METRAWEEAGIYDPKSPGAVERAALLEYLSERGASIAEMVEAHATGSLPGVAGDLVTQGTPMVSVREIAERSAMPLPLVLRLLLAAGIPARADSEVPQEISAFLAAFEEGASIMGEEATLAFVRVLGAAANNIAEAAVALFFAELGPGSVREGPDELARAQIAEAATTAFTRVPGVVAGMVLHAFERAQHRAEMARQPWGEEGGDDSGQAEGPTEVVALGFVDLVGSTAWAQSLSLREQNLALTRFESAAWSSAVLAGGRVIKTIGDEVFFTAPSADTACRIAIEVCDAAAADHILPPARGAVGIGPVTPREGDYFGPLVNLLARSVKAAAPGEIVVTEAVADALARDAWRVWPLEPTAIRGIESPVQAFHVKHQGPGH